MSADVQKEIKTLKQFAKKFSTLNSHFADIRDIELDDFFSTVIKRTNQFKDINGRSLKGYFYKNARDNHDLYLTNHATMTQTQVNGMINDMIEAIKGHRKPELAL